MKFREIHEVRETRATKPSLRDCPLGQSLRTIETTSFSALVAQNEARFKDWINNGCGEKMETEKVWEDVSIETVMTLTGSLEKRLLEQSKFQPIKRLADTNRVVGWVPNRKLLVVIDFDYPAGHNSFEKRLGEYNVIPGWDYIETFVKGL